LVNSTGSHVIPSKFNYYGWLMDCMLQAGLIIAGWDAHDGAAVWALPLGGTLLKVPYAIGGSGSAYIYGFCDKHFRYVLKPPASLLMFQ
jgi:20S proteasome alpha/beta subunit